MNSGNQEIDVDGTSVTEGTSLYDTEYDRVLWITNIDESGVTVDPVTDYDVYKPTGWPPGDHSKKIVKGTVFSIHDLKSLVNSGRFEVSR